MFRAASSVRYESFMWIQLAEPFMKRSLHTEEDTARKARNVVDTRKDDSSTKAEYAALRARIAARKAKLEQSKAGGVKPSEEPKGLNAPVHPLVLQQSQAAQFEEPKPADSARVVEKENPYLQELPEDAEIPTSSYETRRRKGLDFSKIGTYQLKAAKLREQIALEEAKQAINEQISGGAQLTPESLQYKPQKPPDVEWWDDAVLIESSKSYDESCINYEAITEYIQHPIPIIPPWQAQLPREAKAYLSKKEIKRIRKNERAERLKESQDRIRLGLDPTPPPKVKLSNMMSIFAHEAIRDPTAVEQRAKDEIRKRKEKHEKDNQDRKLTEEQRYEKMIAKDEKQKQVKGTHCAVFRVEDLSDKKHKFLVNSNVKYLLLHGILVFGPCFALIIVEGSLLGINKVVHLLMNRIKWTHDTALSTEEPSDVNNNTCSLVWKGEVKKHRFHKWSLVDVNSDDEAKQLLSRHDAYSYWLEASALPENS